MQLRTRLTFLLLCFLAIVLFISCKKQTDAPAAHVPKIKKEWAGNDIRTFTYDDKGRVTKIVYSLYGRDEYQYTDTGIVINFYDTFNTWKSKKVYKLDNHGRAISYSNTASTNDVNTYTYTSAGQLLTSKTVRTIPGDPDRIWEYHYFYTNNNLDSVVRSFTDGSTPTISTDYYDEYYLTIPDTRGNDNFGQSFLGVSSKNALKAARDIGTSGTYQPTTTYDYEFDESGRIIIQHHHWGTSSFIDLNYSYYEQ